MKPGRLLALAALLAAWPAVALPNLSRARLVGPLTLYPDDRRASLYYYGPGEISLAQGTDGRPELSFLLARYAGTAATGDQGAIVYRSLLTVGVRQNQPTPAQLEVARRGLVRGAELRPLPIQRLEARLGYTPLNAPEANELPEGHFEGGMDGASGAQWQNRTYVLALGPSEAELLWGAFERGQLVLSFSYVYFALGKGSDREPESLPEPRQVRAGATSLAVDARRWPENLRKVDINQDLPPGYAVTSLYCYDFQDALRPDLYEKSVELVAAGVGGKEVRTHARFSAHEPDIFALSLRFPVAVQMDRPLRFRAIETLLDGTERHGPWREASWSRILDVTTPPEARPPLTRLEEP